MSLISSSLTSHRLMRSIVLQTDVRPLDYLPDALNHTICRIQLFNYRHMGGSGTIPNVLVRIAGYKNCRYRVSPYPQCIHQVKAIHPRHVIVGNETAIRGYLSFTQDSFRTGVCSHCKAFRFK